MTTTILKVGKCRDCPFFESDSGPACGEAGCFLSDDIDPRDLEGEEPPSACALRSAGFEVTLATAEDKPKTLGQALFDKFGKSGFLLGLREVISRHPTWAPDATQAMSEGIALALAREREERAVIERGFQALFGNKRIVRGAAWRRRFIEEAVNALSVLGSTPFQRAAQEAVAAGKREAERADEQ